MSYPNPDNENNIGSGERRLRTKSTKGNDVKAGFIIQMLDSDLNNVRMVKPDLARYG